MAFSQETAAPGSVLQDADLWKEQQRMYNFLQYYDLHKYYQRLVHMGVTRLTHFKDVTDADLAATGFSPPEKTRLRKKLEENFSAKGKLMKSIVGKRSRFDIPAPDQAHRTLTEPTLETASLIAREEIKLGDKIGEGAHGSVFEGTWSNAHGSVMVAVKTLSGQDEVQSTFIKEADSMRALRHPHIIRLYGIVLSSPLMLVQELAPFGSLHSYLEKEGRSKNIKTFHTYALQIADAMRYLEGKRVVHRDLAARNVLLASEEYIKLSDFGMARILDEHTNVYNLSNLQSRIPIAWTALEALTRAKFSTASDVWSFGVTLWEIFSLATIPWKGLKAIEIRDTLIRGERLGRPERCPTEMYDIITSCWENNPQERPTFASLHQRLQRTPPILVLALNPHAVIEDDNGSCLAFKKGDLIYVIEKSKPGWMFGMLQGGKMGYFLEDHVTDVINPIGDIKEKLQSGKAKVEDLPISGPTAVNHDSHWGKDGKKWGDLENELKSHQTKRSSKLPYEVVNNSPSQSPVNKKPPNSLGHSKSFSGAHAQPPTPRYSSGSETVSVSSPHPLSPTISPNPSEQYVTMKRSGLMAPGEKVQPSKKPTEGSERLQDDAGKESDDDKDYLFMRPNPTGLVSMHTYENIGISASKMSQSEDGEAPYYMTPRSRERITSDVSTRNDEVGYMEPQSQGIGSDFPDVANRSGDAADEAAYMTPRRRESAASSHSESSGGSSAEREKEAERTEGINRRWLHHSISPLPSGLAQDETKARSFTLPGRSPDIASQYSIVTYAPNSLTPFSAPPSDIKNGAGKKKSEKSQFMFQSTARPRPYPKPRKLSSTQSLDFIPLPPPSASSANHELANAVKHLTLNGSHHPGEPLEEVSESDRQPLIAPAPALPERNYLSPIRTLHSAYLPTAQSNALQFEFPDTPPELCMKALEIHSHDVDKAREAVQTQILLGMSILHTDADDCRRALKHCQGKIDRAAAWLIERSEELERRRT